MQINEFVKLGGDQLIPYYADILGAILPCISDKEDKIRVVRLALIFCIFYVYPLTYMLMILLSITDVSFSQVARETNEELRNIHADPAEGFDIGAILSIARRCFFFPLLFFCQLREKTSLKVTGAL